MQITFCGAAKMVTGSCYLIETEQVRFIIDCGMFQGSKEIRQYNQEPFLFDPGEIDFMLLSHAHIDHSGLIPKLYKAGYRKPVYTTKATLDLSKISLPDSGHIQEMEAEWRNRKRLRKGLPPEEPLYTANDALQSMALFIPQNYEEVFQPLPGIKVRFLDAGHIMGSAIIELWVTEGGKTTKIVFSGDLGQKDQPIIKDPTYVEEADYVMVESTYGNRLHDEQADKTELLQKVILQTINSGGNLIIPAFTIGRTQDILYHLKTLFLSGRIPRIPVYIDSPMAVSVTEIYRENPGYYDEQTLNMLQLGESPFEFDGLHFIRTAEESKQLNQNKKSAIIISANGMCEAGRILHHLKHNLWRSDSHILFVGYQAEETLGRRLLEGAKVVKIMGEEVNVQAAIHEINGFSAHADQKGLLDWLSGFKTKPRGLFIVHGEPAVQQEFAELLKDKLGVQVHIPNRGEIFQLNAAAHLSASINQAEAEYYVIERTLSSLEHTILAMQNQLHKGEMTDADRQVQKLRGLIAELEEAIKNPV